MEAQPAPPPGYCPEPPARTDAGAVAAARGLPHGPPAPPGSPRARYEEELGTARLGAARPAALPAGTRLPRARPALQARPPSPGQSRSPACRGGGHPACPPRSPTRIAAGTVRGAPLPKSSPRNTPSSSRRRRPGPGPSSSSPGPARPQPPRRDGGSRRRRHAPPFPSRRAASLHTAAPPRRACAWVRRADEASAQVPPGPRPGGGGGRPGRAQNVALDKCCGGSARKE